MGNPKDQSPALLLAASSKRCGATRGYTAGRLIAPYIPSPTDGFSIGGCGAARFGFQHVAKINSYFYGTDHTVIKKKLNRGLMRYP
jgi:hypothetical protein